MPVCPICQSEDFELFDGHYFCNECSTQSQEIREEERDDESSFQNPKCLRTIYKRDRSQSKQEDKNTLWFSCEAYNIILNRQVEALIQLGASPALKNVVMELWLRYLKRCEVAFVSDQDDWTPRLSSFPSCRDISVVLNGKNPTASKSVKRKKRKKYQYQLLDGIRHYTAKKKKSKKRKSVKVKKKKKKSSNDEEPNNVDLKKPDDDAIIAKKKRKKKNSSDPEEPSNVDLKKSNDEVTVLKEKQKSSNVEISKDDSTMPKKDEAEGQSKTSKKKRGLHDLKNYSKVARKKIRMIGTKVLWGTGRAENCVDRMTLSKTISFCYAGLLLLQEQILLSDIMRWIHECHIPFLNAYRVLPESMVLRSTDVTSLKSPSIPNRRNIVRESSRLLFFLEERKIPQQPVCQMALRYIMDLNLPNELAVVLHQLVNSKCPELLSTLNAPTVITEKKHVPYYELEAGALVVVVLKIIFGLDGKRERDLSTLARELNTCSDLNAECQTFVWDDWQEQMHLKLNRQKIMNVTSMNYSAKDSLDVKSLHSFCKELRYRPPDAKNVELTSGRSTEQKRAIHKAFSSLPNMNQKMFGYAPNSFPISTSTAEYVSQEYEVAHFLRDFSTYTLPRKKDPSHRYWKIPFKGRRNVAKTMEFLDMSPQSFQVLMDAMCYTTNCLATSILIEVKQIEKLVFKSRLKPKKQV